MAKILYVANTSWYLYNFRLSLMQTIQSSGWEVVAVAPWDRFSQKLSDKGFKFVDLAMDRKGTSPFSDLRLLHRLEGLLRPEGTFMLTYGDGVIDLNINELLAFHRSHGRLATVTAGRPQARFGGVRLDDGVVTEFKEKPQTEGSWINGGFFVLEPGVFDYLHGDATVLEEEPLENLARDRQLMAYSHQGFWHCMDTIRDRNLLEHFWTGGNAPWKV